MIDSRNVETKKMKDSEKDSGSETLKVTLSAIFIATYTSLLFAIPQVKEINPESFIGGLIYNIFIFFGLLVDLFFFLYVAFYGLELSSKKKTFEIFLIDIELQSEEVKDTKNWFFESGIRLVFFSLGSLPATVVLVKFLHLFQDRFGEFTGFLISFGAYAIIVIIFGIILHSMLYFLRKKRSSIRSENDNSLR
jgi:hypothetical protein